MRPSIDADGRRHYLLGDFASFVPGKGKHDEINGVDIAVFRFGDFVVAFGNRCPHEGGNLCNGRLEGRQVVCPRHGWKFDVGSGMRDLDPEEAIPIYSHHTMKQDSILHENGDLLALRAEKSSMEPWLHLRFFCPAERRISSIFKKAKSHFTV